MLPRPSLGHDLRATCPVAHVGALLSVLQFYCPHPGCSRSFAELWRLKVHFRAPPDVRGSGKERGHGTELKFCPQCGKELKPGEHHVGCAVSRGGGGERGGKQISQAARWDQRLVEVKAWVVRERRYPSSRKTPEGEGSMRQWLRDNLPGNKMYTPARRKKLNDAFGEGWEADFKDAKWVARLAEVKAWVVEKGDFPRDGRRVSEEERSMYKWLHRNLPGAIDLADPLAMAVMINDSETNYKKCNIKIILDGEKRGKDIISFNNNGNVNLATQVSRSNFLNTLKKSLV